MFFFSYFGVTFSQNSHNSVKSFYYEEIVSS